MNGMTIFAQVCLFVCASLSALACPAARAGLPGNGAASAGAAGFKTYYQFEGGTVGATPSNVVSDAAGNLYASAFNAGANNGGTLLQLTKSHGKYTASVLYDFCARPACHDGFNPDRELVMDGHGNLYGVTLFGGNSITNGYDACGLEGCGVVFRLSHDGAGWKYNVIHRFRGGADGCWPQARLTLDKHGNLFGTASGCGISNNGTVYRLAPTGGRWKLEVVHAFTNVDDDGATPYAGVALDGAGNLFGSTGNGGTYHVGTVFQISRSQGGWTARTLHSFNNDRKDGQNPYSGVTVDAEGSIYGATYAGGSFAGQICSSGCGTIFKLTKSAGVWSEAILHVFSGDSDGAFPGGRLVLGQDGAIYGAATQGGDKSCDDGYGCGVVFRLVLADGAWAEETLHQFTGQDDGWAPRELSADADGVLRGNAANGGKFNSGTLFLVRP